MGLYLVYIIRMERIKGDILRRKDLGRGGRGNLAGTTSRDILSFLEISFPLN